MRFWSDGSYAASWVQSRDATAYNHLSFKDSKKNWYSNQTYIDHLLKLSSLLTCSNLFSISIGGLLLARVIAVTFCVTLSASLAARLGPIPMAAFQTCLQVWMTSSLLADGLAVAIQVHQQFFPVIETKDIHYRLRFPFSQAILACSFAEKDYVKVTTAATRTLQMSFVLGVGLSVLVGGGLYFGAGVFSKDVAVIHLIRLGLPVYFPHTTQWFDIKSSLILIFYLISFQFSSVRCCYATDQFVSLCLRWCELWSIWFRLLCIFLGKFACTFSFTFFLYSVISVKVYS